MRQTLPLLLILVGMALTVIAKDTPATKVTFFVEHQVDPDKDYLQIVVNIKAEDTSLKEALADAE